MTERNNVIRYLDPSPAIENFLNSTDGIFDLSEYLKLYDQNLLPFLRRHAMSYVDSSLVPDPSIKRELRNAGISIGSCIRGIPVPGTITAFPPNFSQAFDDIFLKGVMSATGRIGQKYPNPWFASSVLDLRACRIYILRIPQQL